MAGSLPDGLKRYFRTLASPIDGAVAIVQTEEWVRERVSHTVTGHDWAHVERVRNVARDLAVSTGADRLVVDMIALLHDVEDHKFSGLVDGPRNAALAWLRTLGLAEDVCSTIVEGVAQVSYSSSRGKEATNLEVMCVRDADRLDALGAVGIARAFSFGGWSHQALFPNSSADRTTIDHFFSKILRLAGEMSTARGRALAYERHLFVLEFLEHLAFELSDSELASAIARVRRS